MDVDKVKVTFDDVNKRSADEDRLLEECTVCGDDVPRPVAVDSIVPELEADLCNTTFCSYVCAREFCRMLVQHSTVQMGQVNTRFAKFIE